MGLGNIGMGEILVILVIVLLLFGARRIPEIAGSMGKGIREFKKNMTDVERAMREPADTPAAPPAQLDRERKVESLATPSPSESVPVDRDRDREEPRRLLS